MTAVLIVVLWFLAVTLAVIVAAAVVFLAWCTFLDFRDHRNDQRVGRAIEDPTCEPASQDLRDEDRADMGRVHTGCFDSYADGSAACAECTPALDTWADQRAATAVAILAGHKAIEEAGRG